LKSTITVRKFAYVYGSDFFYIYKNGVTVRITLKASEVSEMLAGRTYRPTAEVARTPEECEAAQTLLNQRMGIARRYRRFCHEGSRFDKRNKRRDGVLARAPKPVPCTRYVLSSVAIEAPNMLDECSACHHYVCSCNYTKWGQTKKRDVQEDCDVDWSEYDKFQETISRIRLNNPKANLPSFAEWVSDPEWYSEHVWNGFGRSQGKRVASSRRYYSMSRMGRW
jgi:hypothetical protein